MRFRMKLYLFLFAVSFALTFTGAWFNSPPVYIFGTASWFWVIYLIVYYIYSKREKKTFSLKDSTKLNEIVMLNPSTRIKEFKCGHKGPVTFEISVYGEVFDRFKQIRKCHNCLIAEAKEVMIHCALCGLVISPGQPVALYAKNSDNFYEEAIEVNGSVIGCLRSDCCPSGGFFAGHWDGEKFEPVFNHGNSVAAEVFATGKPIVVKL